MATAKRARKAKTGSKGAKGAKAGAKARATTKARTTTKATPRVTKGTKRGPKRAPTPAKRAARQAPSAPREKAARPRAQPAAAKPAGDPRSPPLPAAPPVFDGTVLELETIRQEVLLPGVPDAVFDAYVDGAKHAAFTGSAAESTPRVGGRFRAYDGYIDGVFLELVRGKRIVQSWRATDFPPEYPHSRLEIHLEPQAGGTKLSMRHSEVPRSMAPAYAQGWEEFYWEPLERYLA